MTTPQTLAILFADVSGSTRLYEKLGDRAALQAVEMVLDLLRKSVAAYRGRVVKTIGDEIMAVFPGADECLQAACDMQTRVSGLPPYGEIQLAIRIGFHFGAVIEESNDFYGDAVNTAARMAGIAKGTQIITTAATVDALSALLRQSTREITALAVKGKQSEIRVCEVLWQGGDDVTMLAGTHGRSAAIPVLRLSHKGRELLVDSEAVHIGRDATHQIVVADKMASRLHGRIERRVDKFYYIDLSTNGTYVTVEGDMETCLRRDQTMLRGSGILSFGHTAADPGTETVSYVVEYRQA
jgi:class 3 adenylate cyclase